MKKYFIISGGAGFVASNLIKSLISNKNNIIIAIDDFTLGHKANISKFKKKNNFFFFKQDINKIDLVLKKLKYFDFKNNPSFFYHLAANSDVKKPQNFPNVDIEKTLLTTISSVKIFNALKLKYFIFTSSPVIYGEVNKPINKNTKELPISNYGYAKLFSEKYISKAINKKASVWVFRFPNVVGPFLTHGILFDFNIKLKKNKSNLKVLGNGKQKKPYLHVDDIVRAIKIPIKSKFSYNYFSYNLSPKDDGIEISKIAKLFIKLKGLNIPIIYQGGARGWEGDVPKYSYDYKNKQDLNWQPRFSSISSIKKAIKDIL